jgi:hypothetical protein
MQEMEPHWRPKMNGLRRTCRPFHAQVHMGDVRIRRQKIKPERHLRSDQMRLRAGQVGAEALAFVALTVRRGIQDQSLVVVVATFVVATNVTRQRRFDNVAVQAVARPMAAPTRYRLDQHENRHQFGNERLHNDPEILPNHYAHRQSRQRSLRKSGHIWPGEAIGNPRK